MDRRRAPEAALVEHHEVARTQRRGELALEPQRVCGRALTRAAGQRDQNLSVVARGRGDPPNVQADSPAHGARPVERHPHGGAADPTRQAARVEGQGPCNGGRERRAYHGRGSDRGPELGPA